VSIALITGSSGLIGSESAFFFLKKGFEVIGIDNNLRKSFFGKDGDTSWIKNKLIKNKKYTHYNCDIRDFNNIQKIFKRYKNNISIVIHAAAQPSHDYAKNNLLLDFKVNAEGTLNIFQNIQKFSPNSKVIFLSTNKVYGDNPNKIKLIEKKTRFSPKNNSLYINGFNEKFKIDDATHSFFGVSKIYGDLLAQEFGKNYGLKIGIFRAGCLTGPNHSGTDLHGFLSFLVKTCLKKKSYNIIGYKGKQVRDNLHSNDLINSFWEFIKKPKKGEVYNIGGGLNSNCSILEAINLIEAKMNIKINISYSKTNRVGDHIWYISDTSKFKKDYPKWKVSYSTETIIDDIIDKYK